VTTSTAAALDRRRTAAVAGIGAATHLLALAVAFVVLHLWQGGEDFEDLGRAVSAFFLTEIVAGLICLVGGAVLFRLGRREVGLGLLAGWVVGVVLLFVFFGVSR
jgi:hypothetical protein